MGRKPKDIEEYRRKRDFEKTPEPPPGAPRPESGDPVFVIHRHDARRLHYDLRLEMGGVLVSWAVPKGLTWDPAIKHLAVRTEDHPMEYLTFSGEIPKGQYGAGTLHIWDSGTYRFRNPDGPGGVANGKLEIILRGRRARGEWHMVRTKPKDDAEDPWLLLKTKDRYARDVDAGDFGPALWEAVAGPLPQGPVSLSRPRAVPEPFDDPDWVFEMAFAGRRAAVAAEDGRVWIAGEEASTPDAVPAALIPGFLGLRAESALLDGVFVVLDGRGRPSRALLDRRWSGESSEPLLYYAFDLLHRDGWDLRPVPLRDRKAALRQIIPSRGPVVYVDDVAGQGRALAAACAAGGLPGLIGKRSDGIYVAGCNPTWVEVRVHPLDGAETKTVTEALESQGGSGPTSDRVKFSNFDKVFWPDAGFTKGDLVGHYARVAEFLLPYLADRPVHMRRCPDGITGEFFYQREAPEHLPPWFETVTLPVHDGGKDVRHMVCSSRDALLYLANLGSVDLHPWLSRASTPEQPDIAAIDLDPKEAPFAHVIRLARSIGKLLRAIEVPAYLKTSGASGLHIYIPLQPGYTYDHSRMFCEAVCRVIHKDHRDISTIERDTRRRQGRVYLDFLQNRRGQTLVPPYAVRPVPAASVSTPLHWDELTDALHPSQFTIANIGDRLSRYGDLFRPTLGPGIDLLKAVDALMNQR